MIGFVKQRTHVISSSLSECGGEEGPGEDNQVVKEDGVDFFPDVVDEEGEVPDEEDAGIEGEDF